MTPEFEAVDPPEAEAEVGAQAPAQTPDLSLVVLGCGDTVDAEAFRAMMGVYRAELDTFGRSYEVIVVDDGQEEDFLKTIGEVKREWPQVRAFRFRRRFGESVALEAAIRNSTGRYLVVTTWYLQVDPSGLHEGVKLLDEGVEFVAYRREGRIDGPLSRFNSWSFNAYTRWLTGVALKDLNCGFRMFRRNVVEELRFHGDLYRFLAVFAEQKGFRVQELPVQHRMERGRPAFLQPGLYIRRFLDVLSLFFLLKFTSKPLRFFGLVGSVFFLAGLAISLRLTWLRLVADEGLTERPILILGVFLMVLGVIVGSIGLIGEIVIFTQERREPDYHVKEIVEGGASHEEETA